jgi:hypothetical protein
MPVQYSPSKFRGLGPTGSVSGEKGFEDLVPISLKTPYSKPTSRLRNIDPMMISAAWAQMAQPSILRGLEYGEDLAELKGRVDDLASSLESMAQELSSCKECVDRLYSEFADRPIIKATWLFDISKDLETIEPIPVVIEETEDEALASFPEIETFAVGAGEAEAINNLKKEISKLYYELVDADDEELGRIPQAWKRVLRKVIRRVGQT